MTKLNNYLTNVYVNVINLKIRSDKREYIHNQLKLHKIEYTLFSAEKHEDPKRGCLESHLTIIKNAIKQKRPYLMILEDDCKFIDSPKNMNKLPPNWDMIYLGGTVHRVLDKKHNGYVRVQCWTTHAYILNLSNPEFCEALLKLEDYDGEIDRYYLEHLHPKFNAYMCDPMIAIQKEGYSDIEGKEVNYDFMQQTLQGLRVPENTVDVEGNYVLKLPEINDNDLPKVSIITPTYNRRKIFDMAIRNFENFNYPKNKLEWVIVDDSVETDIIDESVRDMLPRDKRVKYIRLNSNPEDSPMTIAMKRNIGVSNSSNPYIVHMDDDDYYPPESILARIKILMKYEEEGIECVGSTLIGTYNIIKNTSSMSSDGPISLSEASMAYTKKFWESRPFDELCKRGEHKYFTEQRLHKIIDIPYSFILIAINHRTNFTSEFRSDGAGILKYSKESGKEGEYANFFDTWDLDTQMFIMDLRKYLIK
jgi:hypothetical protein